MDKSLVIELLMQEGVLTPLEQDILDTYHEINKRPFKRDLAIRQIQKNNINHPDIFVEISTNPMTVFKPWGVASDENVYSNLMRQLESLANREQEALQRGQ